MSLPPVLVLEPTNRCNMVCDMCPQGLQDIFGDMDLALATRIIAEAGPSSKYVQCYLLGEPTVRKDICDFLNIVRQHTKAVIEVSTNLVRCKDRAFADALLCSGVDVLLCCVEGMTAASHGHLRRTGEFDSIVQTVRYLGAKSISLGRGVNVVAKCILNRKNRHEADRFMDFWSSQPGITPAITWLNTWAGTMPHVLEYAVDVSPNAYHERRPCAELWNKLVVRWNGKVVACCHDWRNRVELGDVLDSSLAEIWTGSAMDALRKEHIAGTFAGICSPCIEWSTPEEFEGDFGLAKDAIVIPKA